MIGNPTSYDGWTYIWRGGRKLVQTFREGCSVDFKYNTSGLRTWKRVIENGDITDYDYFLHGKLLTHLIKTHGAEKEQLHFYYDAQSKPIMMRYGEDEGGQYYTFVHSLQGDILGIVDRKQQVVVEYLYDPWGKVLDVKHGESDVTSLELAEKLAKLNPFRYRGYLYDEEIGVYYLKSRYYSPKSGRFINADKLFGKMGSLLSHNMYGYCKNDPIQLLDPHGTAPVMLHGGSSVMTIASAYGSAGGVTTVVTQYLTVDQTKKLANAMNANTSIIDAKKTLAGLALETVPSLPNSISLASPKLASKIATKVGANLMAKNAIKTTLGSVLPGIGTAMLAIEIASIPDNIKDAKEQELIINAGTSNGKVKLITTTTVCNEIEFTTTSVANWDSDYADAQPMDDALTIYHAEYQVN